MEYGYLNGTVPTTHPLPFEQIRFRLLAMQAKFAITGCRYRAKARCKWHEAPNGRIVS